MSRVLWSCIDQDGCITSNAPLFDNTFDKLMSRIRDAARMLRAIINLNCNVHSYRYNDMIKKKVPAALQKLQET